MNKEGLDPLKNVRNLAVEVRKRRFFPVDVVDSHLQEITPDLEDRRAWNRRITKDPSLAKEFNRLKGFEVKRKEK